MDLGYVQNWIIPALPSAAERNVLILLKQGEDIAVPWLRKRGVYYLPTFSASKEKSI